jgi:hypothetical protein
MEDDLGDAAAPHGHRHEDGGLGELGVGVVVAAAPPAGAPIGLCTASRDRVV